MIMRVLGYNENGPGGATNTLRGLTHSLDLTKEGLGMNPTRICTIDGCDKLAFARGWCTTHYERWRRHGDPMNAGRGPQFFTAEERFNARTERRGDCLIWTGGTQGNGYPKMIVNGSSVPSHRYAWESVHGPIEAGLEVDHLCHEPLCCEVAHLRLTTRKQNMEHRQGAPSNSTTGVLGVSWNRKLNKYQVTVRHNDRSVYGGIYVTLPEAEAAAIALRKRLFTHNDRDRRAA